MNANTHTQSRLPVTEWREGQGFEIQPRKGRVTMPDTTKGGQATEAFLFHTFQVVDEGAELVAA